MGSTVRLRFPCCWAFFLVFKTCVFSFLAFNPGTPEYRLFGPWAVSLFFDTPPGLLCVHLCLAWRNQV